MQLLIADDTTRLFGGGCEVCWSRSRISRSSEAGDGREAVELYRSLVPDIVLMDVRMPEMDGLSATPIIKKERPEIGVVMATMHENHTYMHEALQIGAVGYILKMQPGPNSPKLCGTPRTASDEPQRIPALTKKPNNAGIRGRRGPGPVTGSW